MLQTKVGMECIHLQQFIFKSVYSDTEENTSVWYFMQIHTVKLFNFVGSKFCGLTTVDMFVDTWFVDFKLY